MNVVVAMDSFKGSASAVEACAAVARGIQARIPGAQLVLKPMADGGEGTAATVLAARGGEWTTVEVDGPLPGPRPQAGYAWLPEAGPAAMVEMAAASGLDLLRPDQLDPLATTTFGTGQLLAAAFARAPEILWLAIGGSATVDGGMGAAQALGWRFLDRHDAEVGRGGAELERVQSIQPPPGWSGPPAPVEVLCDVDNPLLGPRGAAEVFGPQKGATPAMVDVLEAGLANLAEVIHRDLGKDVRDVPGAGAAGGLGAGALAFLDARLVSGIQAVMHASGLEEAVADADWVITGEGRFDDQSLHGKVVSGVAEMALRHGTKVAVVAGSVAANPDEALRHGILSSEAAAPDGMPLEEAMARGPELIESASLRLAERLGDSPA